MCDFKLPCQNSEKCWQAFCQDCRHTKITCLLPFLQAAVLRSMKIPPYSGPFQHPMWTLWARSAMWVRLPVWGLLIILHPPPPPCDVFGQIKTHQYWTLVRTKMTNHTDANHLSTNYHMPTNDQYKPTIIRYGSANNANQISRGNEYRWPTNTNQKGQ